MESVVIDQSLVKPGKAFALNAGRLCFNSYNPSFSPLSQLSLNVQGAANNSLGLGLFGSRPPPYASLPPFPSSTPFFVHQPPLLPFPILRSASLPPPAKRVAAASSSAVKPRDQQKKRKPRKERRLLPPQRGEATPVVPEEPKGREEEEGEEVILLAPEKPVLKPKEGGDEVEKEEKERVGFTGSLYSISPPPSSLPLPSFFLKPKTVVAGASCTMEAMGDSSSGKAVDACATDELRRLLGL